MSCDYREGDLIVCIDAGTNLAITTGEVYRVLADTTPGSDSVMIGVFQGYRSYWTSRFRRASAHEILVYRERHSGSIWKF